jgi:hypothetical protein
MAVLDPLKVTIENWDMLELPTHIDVPDFPTEPDNPKKHTIAFDKIVYIDRSDYQSVSRF